MGLIDRNWITRCPLITELADDPSFAELSDTVVRRADSMLAAFRAVMA
jgi:hypothetical protein